MEMIFNEIYSKYYYALAQVLTKSHTNAIDIEEIKKIFTNTYNIDEINDYTSVHNKAQSAPPCWEALLQKQEDGKYKSKLINIPEKPLTTLEKQWLKSVLCDPKMKLFFSDPDKELEHISGLLKDTKPLYSSDAFVYYDQHKNSDAFDDENFRKIFRTIIQAKEENKMLRLSLDDKTTFSCAVENLEYSENEDIFRVIVIHNKKRKSIKLCSIKSCECLDIEVTENDLYCEPSVEKTITLELVDEFNALDRAMVSFSDLKKTTEKTGTNTYEVKLSYYEDEDEIISRILSFGSVFKAKDEYSKNLISKRLRAQYDLFSESGNGIFIKKKK